MSEISIEIVDVATEKVRTYQKMSVTYKVSFGGQVKVDAKALVEPYTPKHVWAALSGAKKGDQFVVTREKDEKGFWVWQDIRSEDGEPVEDDGGTAVPAAAPARSAAPKRSFDERDEARQKYIVRQSSLGHAVALLAARGSDTTPDNAIAIAKQFEAFVFGDE